MSLSVVVELAVVVSLVVLLVDVTDGLVDVVEVFRESTSFSGASIPSEFVSTAGLLVSLETKLLVDMLTDFVLVERVDFIVSVVTIVSAVVDVDVLVEFCKSLAGKVGRFKLSSEAVVWKIQSGAVVWKIQSVSMKG